MNLDNESNKEKICAKYASMLFSQMISGAVDHENKVNNWTKKKNRWQF